jgi:hypothetical protein
LGNIDEITIVFYRWKLEYFRDQIDQLLVDDSNIVFLGKAMPPSTSDAQAQLPVDLSLAGKYFPHAIHALLNILSQLLVGISER